jgi:hypothetical protein
MIIVEQRYLFMSLLLVAKVASTVVRFHSANSMNLLKKQVEITRKKKTITVLIYDSIIYLHRTFFLITKNL